MEPAVSTKSSTMMTSFPSTLPISDNASRSSGCQYAVFPQKPAARFNSAAKLRPLLAKPRSGVTTTASKFFLRKIVHQEYETLLRNHLEFCRSLEFAEHADQWSSSDLHQPLQSYRPAAGRKWAHAADLFCRFGNRPCRAQRR